MSIFQEASRKLTKSVFVTGFTHYTMDGKDAEGKPNGELIRGGKVFGLSPVDKKRGRGWQPVEIKCDYLVCRQLGGINLDADPRVIEFRYSESPKEAIINAKVVDVGTERLLEAIGDYQLVNLSKYDGELEADGDAANVSPVSRLERPSSRRPVAGDQLPVAGANGGSPKA